MDEKEMIRECRQDGSCPEYNPRASQGRVDCVNGKREESMVSRLNLATKSIYLISVTERSKWLELDGERLGKSELANMPVSHQPDALELIESLEI